MFDNGFLCVKVEVAALSEDVEGDRRGVVTLTPVPHGALATLRGVVGLTGDLRAVLHDLTGVLNLTRVDLVALSGVVSR